MRAYLEILDDLKLEVEERPNGKSWNWLKIWKRISDPKSKQDHDDPGTQRLSGWSLFTFIFTASTPIFISFGCFLGFFTPFPLSELYSFDSSLIQIMSVLL